MYFSFLWSDVHCWTTWFHFQFEFDHFTGIIIKSDFGFCCFLFTYIILIDSDLDWLYECKWLTQAGPYCVYLHIIPLLIMYLLVCVVWMGGQLWVWMCAHVCVSASAVLCTKNCVGYTSLKRFVPIVHRY